MISNFVFLRAGNMVWFCIRKIQTELNKRWRRTLPCRRSAGKLEAVMNAGKLSWNTTCGLPQKYAAAFSSSD